MGVAFHLHSGQAGAYDQRSLDEAGLPRWYELCRASRGFRVVVSL